MCDTLLGFRVRTQHSEHGHIRAETYCGIHLSRASAVKVGSTDSAITRGLLQQRLSQCAQQHTLLFRKHCALRHFGMRNSAGLDVVPTTELEPCGALSASETRCNAGQAH